MLTSTQPETALRFARETIESHHRQARRDQDARIAAADRLRAAATARRGARTVRPADGRWPRPASTRA